MTGTGKRVILLPEMRRFAGQRPSAAFIRKARRFKTDVLGAGESLQLQRYFHCIPEAVWPVAALCRQDEQGDAGAEFWLRADPVFLQVEMRGARIMSCTDFDISGQDMQAIQDALQPYFADHGVDLRAGNNGFFYIRITNDSPLPSGAAVADMLGCDIAGHLPVDRRWMALFNETQITLHNHPLNVSRQRNGMLPVNGLWFWGGGVLPSTVMHEFASVDSEDGLIRALAGQTDRAQGNADLCDLRHIRSWPTVESAFREAGPTVFDFADGTRWHWQPSWHRHFWRRNSVAVFR